MANFKDISSTNELIKYLELKGGNHDFYYHYTDIESLEKIIENGTFLLTRGNALSINDQHEAKMKGCWQTWNKTYIGSFAFGSAENMAMWGLYCLPPEDAVRICIPKAAMKIWLENIDSISAWKDGIKTLTISAFEKALSDIVYIEGKKGDESFKLLRASEQLKVENNNEFYRVDEKEEMTGYIKNAAWKYENEVRLKIKLQHAVGNDKICVPIPSETLNAITVTTGPQFEWRESTVLQRLEKESRIFESDFSNLLNYRLLCSKCTHERFMRKNNG